jgi:hypothetical protein
MEEAEWRNALVDAGLLPARHRDQLLGELALDLLADCPGRADSVC